MSKSPFLHKPFVAPLLLLLGIVLYALGLPPVSFGPALLVGITLLAMASTRVRFVTLWGYGIILHLGLYGWLSNVSYLGLVTMAALFGALWAVPLHLWKRWGNPVGVAAIWVLLELTRSHLGWGWLPVASGAIGMPSVLGWAAIGGEFLLGGIMIAWALFLAAALQHPRSRPRWMRVLLCTIVMLSGGILADRISPMAESTEIEPLRVGIVQPAMRMDLNKSTQEMISDFEQLTNATSTLKGQVDIIAWPEQITPWPVNADARMKNWVESGAQYLGADILTGALWVDFGQGETHAEQYHNAVVQVRKNSGLTPNFYAKRRLVPFGEYVPFAELGWMHSFTPIVDSFTPGKPEGKALLVQKAWRIWPLICYEDTFWQMAIGASNDADAMMVFTNDAWFGSMGAHSQHFSHSILRAVEQGIPLLRVANDGISGLIAPDGSTQIMRDNQGRTDTANAKIVELRPYRRYTLYAHTPVWLWPTIVWATCIILISKSVGKQLR